MSYTTVLINTAIIYKYIIEKAELLAQFGSYNDHIKGCDETPNDRI